MLKIKSNRIIKFEIDSANKLLDTLNELKMTTQLNTSNHDFLNICLKKLDDQELGIGEFRKQFSKLLKGKSKFQYIFWESRGYSTAEAKILAQEHSSSAAKTAQSNRTPEERTTLAMKANKKRVEQMKKLAISNPLKLKEQMSTTIEYYLAKGMNHEEAEKALKERQSTFSKKKMIEKFGEIKGLKIVKERNDKWISSLKENNDWGELSKSKAVTLEKMIEKYGEIEGTEKYQNWIIETRLTISNYEKWYGEKGLYEYTKMNKSRGYKQTLNYYIDEFGEELGLQKWKNRMDKIRINCGDASNESLKIFIPLLNEFKNSHNCYLGYENYNEWFIWDNDLRKQFRYDFTLRDSKIIIEYNGEAFHPNKNKLSKDEWDSWKSPFSKTSAEEVFKQDQHKLNLARENGFKVLELWSSTSIEENIETARKFILENS